MSLLLFCQFWNIFAWGVFCLWVGGLKNLTVSNLRFRSLTAQKVSQFSRIRAEYWDLQSKSLYSIQIQEKSGPAETLYLDTFHAVYVLEILNYGFYGQFILLFKTSFTFKNGKCPASSNFSTFPEFRVRNIDFNKY